MRKMDFLLLKHFVIGSIDLFFKCLLTKIARKISLKDSSGVLEMAAGHGGVESAQGLLRLWNLGTRLPRSDAWDEQSLEVSLLAEPSFLICKVKI